MDAAGLVRRKQPAVKEAERREAEAGIAWSEVVLSRARKEMAEVYPPPFVGLSCAFRGCSREDFTHHLAVDIGEAEIAAEVAPSEALVIQAKQMQNGGM